MSLQRHVFISSCVCWPAVDMYQGYLTTRLLKYYNLHTSIYHVMHNKGQGWSPLRNSYTRLRHRVVVEPSFWTGVEPTPQLLYTTTSPGCCGAKLLDRGGAHSATPIHDYVTGLLWSQAFGQGWSPLRNSYTRLRHRVVVEPSFCRGD